MGNLIFKDGGRITMVRARDVGRQALRLAERSNDNLTRLGEAGIAAAQTIAARSHHLARAAGDPRELHHPEITRMMTEKVEAVLQSAAAALPKLGEPAAITAEWMSHQTALVTELAGAVASRPIDPTGISLQNYARGMLFANLAFASAMMASMTGIGERAFKPLHDKVTRNARRLSK